MFPTQLGMRRANREQRIASAEYASWLANPLSNVTFKTTVSAVFRFSVATATEGLTKVADIGSESLYVPKGMFAGELGALQHIPAGVSITLAPGVTMHLFGNGRWSPVASQT